jgi:TolB-like protein/tetratricopeptide (TPR) repeat protein
MSDIPGNPKASRKLAAILAADIAGYSALMGADEAGTVRDIKRHQTAILPMIADHGGRIIDTAGDGILAEFASVVNAVECAVAIQKMMAERNSVAEVDRRMQFRIGINLSDVIHDEARIYGDGVNIAARLESIAEPGGICISGEAYGQVQRKLRLEFTDIGDQQLKNIAQPVRVYRVAAQTMGASAISQRPALTLPDKPSIAVLPFNNMSGDPEQDYFADGVVEEIITGLSRIRWLFVIARNSSFIYKGRAVDVKQVGRELGVRYVLGGSIRKAGNRIRVTGQLIDASVGTHLWADRFDGSLDDVFALQDQVTENVVGAILPKLEQAEIERARRKPTESLDAYDLFLRGMASFHKLTRKDIDDALRLWLRAIELDQEFASAYAMASMCYTRRKMQGWTVDREQQITEATRLAREAVKYGKGDALALSFAGYTLAFVAGELTDGAGYIDQALSLNPNLAAARYFGGWVKIWLGEPDLAIELIMQAMRLSPVDPLMSMMLHSAAHAHFFAGRYEEGVAKANMSLREHPENPAALRIAAASNALAGRMEEAASMMVRLRRLDPSLRVSNLRYILGPYRHQEHLAMYEDGLRRAGLPE